MMKREDWVFAIGVASLLASAYVKKLVTNKEREEKAQKAREQAEKELLNQTT